MSAIAARHFLEKDGRPAQLAALLQPFSEIIFRPAAGAARSGSHQKLMESRMEIEAARKRSNPLLWPISVISRPRANKSAPFMHTLRFCNANAG
jgi:hypothetical protein